MKMIVSISSADMRPAPTSSASPLFEGERIEVRGFIDWRQLQNPHPALSLEKGEANMR
jgi:hypothetical protein